ncbi:MAG: hypothetical protein MJ252_28160 [archaeon]|nr:hypothetical protein [archaeon]
MNGFRPATPPLRINKKNSLNNSVGNISNNNISNPGSNSINNTINNKQSFAEEKFDNINLHMIKLENKKEENEEDDLIENDEEEEEKENGQTKPENGNVLVNNFINNK